MPNKVLQLTSYFMHLSRGRYAPIFAQKSAYCTLPLSLALHARIEKMPIFESHEISSLQAKLNSKEFAPKRGFRRNVTVYSLVCYVNNITGCYLSKNSDPIPVFIGRSRIHMKEFPAHEEWESYYELVDSYLNLVESHLKDYGVDTNYL